MDNCLRVWIARPSATVRLVLMRFAALRALPSWSAPPSGCDGVSGARQEWLEAELECLGIDSAAYARTVLSLLSRDTIDPAEVIQSGYVLVANKVHTRLGRT